MKRWFAVPLSLILAVPLGAQRPSDLADDVKQYVTVDAEVVALTNVALIDGTGAAVKYRQTIIIENGWIRAVGNTGDVHVPAGADVHDLTGHTVIPGMMGLHNHMYLYGCRRPRGPAQLQRTAALPGNRRDHHPNHRKPVTLRGDQYQDCDR